MRKILLALLIGIAGIGLVACDTTPETPIVETITLTINYDNNNGLYKQIVEIEKGTTYTFTTPEKENYTFLGWFNGEVEYTDETIFNEDVEVIAKWEKNDGGEEPVTPVEPEEPVTPVEPEEPVTPVEPEEPETPKEELKDKTIEDIADLTQNIFKKITLNVKGYSQIKITIKGESNYDIPVNINNFQFNGEDVSWSGVAGTSYVANHEFEIGGNKAIGNLVNTHQGDLRLHTTHHTLKDPHSIIIDVNELDTISFEYRVTTGAVSFIDALVIGFFI